MKPITLLWQKSLDLSIVPDLLKKQIVLPAMKPGAPRSDPASWRPLSMTSGLIKIFERVLKEFIQSHLNFNDLLSTFQHGFRENRSCLSQLLLFNNKFMEILEEGDNCDIIYLDISKAFD